MNKEGPIIEIKNLSYRYEKDYVLECINLHVHKGDFVGIVGPNGSGKSTLLKLILGLLKVQKGEIRLFGEPISRFQDWESVGYVSQKANSFNTGFPATVYEVVSSGLTKKLGLFHFLKKSDHKKIEEAIELVGLKDFSKRNIGELSGGQQQRAFIARAIVSSPKMLILDEPTVGIDVKYVRSFYDMLEKLNKTQGITLLLVTHDLSLVTEKATHIASMNKKLHFFGKKEEYKDFAFENESLMKGFSND